MFQVEKAKQSGRTAIYGQCSYYGVSKQDGGQGTPSFKYRSIHSSFLRNQGVKGTGAVHTGDQKQVSGPPLKNSTGFFRLVTQPSRIQIVRQQVGSSFSRFFRESKQLLTTKVRVQKSGQSRDVYRWVTKPVEKGERVCKPSVLNYWKGTPTRSSYKKIFDSNSSGMDRSILVAPTTTSTSGYSSTTTERPRLVPAAKTSSNGLSRPAAVGGLWSEDLRKQFEEKKLSKEVTSIIIKKWEPSTIKNYSRIWKRWAVFARGKGCDRLHPDLFTVLDFLNVELKRSSSVALVNHAISSLSSILDLSMGPGLMDSLEVKYFRQAANKLKPTGPSLESIWDITLLLKYIDDMGENGNLSIYDLLHKVVLLLRIDLFARSSDIAKIYRSDVVWHQNFVNIRFLRPKEWRPNADTAFREYSPWVKIYKLKLGGNTCTFSALREWINRSQARAPKVFIYGKILSPLCYQMKKGKMLPLTPREIADISKVAMLSAGVPPSYYPHSLRSAASSAAKDFGASIDSILQQGRWSNKTLWLKYYYRSIDRVIPKRRGGSLQDRLRSAL